MNETKRVEQAAEGVVSDNNPAALLRVAIDKDLDVDKIRQLVDLKDRYDDRQAQKAFNEAFAAFKCEAIQIRKDKKNDRFNSPYASKEVIVGTIVPYLSKHDLYHHWEYGTSDGNQVVTCVLSHKDGHSIHTTLQAPPDTSKTRDGRDIKNPIQAIKSTNTYLESATLMAVTGLSCAAVDLDDDGAAAFGAAATGLITEGEAGVIEKLIEDSGTNRKKFLAWLQTQGIDGVENIPSARFQYVRDMLQKKLDQKEVA